MDRTSALRRSLFNGRRLWHLVLIPLVALGCSAAPDREPTSILLITIDTLRADRLGSYGYFRDTSPALDRFASESVVFDNALAPMATTLPTHVSLMTSTNPSRHGVRGNLAHFGQPLEAEQGLQTLAQMLQGNGYETAAVVGAAALRSSTGIALGFDSFNEPAGHSRIGRRVLKATLAFLDQRSTAPFLLWVHFWDPHSPFAGPGRFRDAFPADDPDMDRYLDEHHFTYSDQERVRRINSRYDGEVRYVDYLLEALFAALEERGLYDEVAIVVAGDHGEGLGQHDWISHGRIHHEQLRVPLMIRFPDALEIQPQRRGDLVALIDVLPTLVAMLELPVDQGARTQFEGRNLFGAGPPRGSVLSERVFRQDAWEPGLKYALTTDEWKYILWSEGPDQLFRIGDDPFELENLIADRPDIAQRMKEQIARQLASYDELGPGFEVGTELSDERLDEMRALGYLD